MRSFFGAFLQGFALPFGRTSGRRIVFDGPNAEIRVYDSLDRLRLQISSGLPSAINLFTGNAAEIRAGGISALSHIVSGETYQSTRIESPANSNDGVGDEFAQVELRSRSVDGSEPPMIALRPGGNAVGELRLGIADDSSGTRNEPLGTAVLVAGTVTVLHTEVTASSRIVHWRQVAGGTLGHLSIGAITAGTSFVINSSSATDTSTIGYLILEPL